MSKPVIFDGGLPVTSMQCMTCRHYTGAAVGVRTGSCKAFRVIPDAIWTNELDHTKPVDGDGGVRYSRLPGHQDEKKAA